MCVSQNTHPFIGTVTGVSALTSRKRTAHNRYSCAFTFFHKIHTQCVHFYIQIIPQALLIVNPYDKRNGFFSVLPIIAETGLYKMPILCSYFFRFLGICGIFSDFRWSFTKRPHKVVMIPLAQNFQNPHDFHGHFFREFISFPRF